MDNTPLLIVFGGLPGTGKSTLAQMLADDLTAVYLRIDTVEQALRNSGAVTGDMGPFGYVIAYALATDNLRLGRTVVADSVNPVAVTRDAWRRVAQECGAEIFEVEVTCSDIEEHRARVEQRVADVIGLVLPTWRDVVSRDYAPWDRPHIVIDTAGRSPAQTLVQLRRKLPITT